MDIDISTLPTPSYLVDQQLLIKNLELLSSVKEMCIRDRFLFVNDVLYLVIPCYNEEAVLYETSKRLLDVINHLVKTEKISSESKIMFVNDGSKDKTWEIIESLHTQNPIFCGVDVYKRQFFCCAAS